MQPTKTVRDRERIVAQYQAARARLADLVGEDDPAWPDDPGERAEADALLKTLCLCYTVGLDLHMEWSMLQAWAHGDNKFHDAADAWELSHPAEKDPHGTAGSPYPGLDFDSPDPEDS